MKKLIQKMTDIEAGKQILKESAVEECGPMMSSGTPQMQGNPVTVSVNFNASGVENVTELLNLLKNSGLQSEAEPSMPSQGMRMDMENFRNIVDAGDQDDNEIDVKFDMDDDNGIRGMSKAESAAWDNEPNEIYADHQTMTHDLSGGINGQKRMYKPAAKGDNPMAVRQESVDKNSLKARLLQALEEKKSKPDFLDVDDDGDRKEPMKKAVADKKKEGPVKEASTGDYSAKKARAGKDIGKPGKKFSKIAKSAAKRYGSKERGEKVAGAVLRNLRAKNK